MTQDTPDPLQKVVMAATPDTPAAAREPWSRPVVKTFDPRLAQAGNGTHSDGSPSPFS